MYILSVLITKLTIRKRNHCLARRTHLLSLLLGCIVPRVSESVTNTAPATNAAGAPKLAVLISLKEMKSKLDGYVTCRHTLMYW